MNKITFTTTHCIRPQILNRTYGSFYKNLKNVDFENSTLFINIDKSPTQADPTQSINVAKKYFGNVITNCPQNPNFTKAVHWCWNQVNDEYFFHLQDDWELVKQVDMKNLLGYHKISDKFCVNIRAYPFIKPLLCLLPGLWKTSYAKHLIKDVDFSINPERQLRSNLQKYHYPIPQCLHYPVDDINAQYVKDIGREWLKGKKLKRNHHSKNFTSWDTGGNGFQIY